MNLTPTEIDRLIVFGAAEFARRNLRLGIRLSHPEAVALLTDEAMLLARQGVAYDEIRDRAYQLLSERDVLPGVRSMIAKVLIELPMLEGTKLLILFDPVLPAEGEDEEIRPGEVIPAAPEVGLHAGVETVELEVVNTGDRDVQVRSATHFFEVNRALSFDREKAYGRRLALPAGSGVRFEPGVAKRVLLMEMAGSREVFGFAGLVEGPLDAEGVVEQAMTRARERGYVRMEQTNDFD
jgi:urease subunit gamma/beta